MNTRRRETLKNLLLSIPDNGIVCASRLCKEGLSHDSLKQYVRHGYLDSLGRGAYCKHGQRPPLTSALHSLAFQLNLPIHLGGREALSRRGFLHFLPFANEPATLYSRHNTRPPAWFKQVFGGQYAFRQTDFLPEGLAVETKRVDDFDIPISAPERAMLEYLREVPASRSLNEAYQIMEMMTNARPDILQPLLERCSSVKVKRLFFLLAEDLNDAWYGDLKPERIDFGTGCRIIDKGGSYRRKWLVVANDWRSL